MQYTTATEWQRRLIDAWDERERAQRIWDAVCGDLGLDDFYAVKALEDLGAFDE
jgi:hypothetical protein